MATITISANVKSYACESCTMTCDAVPTPVVARDDTHFEFSTTLPAPWKIITMGGKDRVFCGQCCNSKLGVLSS